MSAPMRAGYRRGWLLLLLTLTGGMVASSAAAAPGFPPQASFTATPNPAGVGETVMFDANASTCDALCGTITSYEWDLDGDGTFETNSGTTPTTSRAYADPATIDVKLKVTDSDNESDEETVSLQVQSPPPAPPDANFTFAPATPTTGQVVSFDGTASTAPANETITGTWDLDGDGQFDDATGLSAQFTYATPGARTVSLRADSSGGGSDVTSETIEVTQAAPAAFDLMSPFPVVRLSGKINRGGATVIERLAVRAPQGSTVTVRCKGRSCPFEQRVREAKQARVRFPEIEGRFEPGALIEIFVTDPQVIGKYTRFKLRNHKVPKRVDRCVIGETREPTSCPRS